MSLAPLTPTQSPIAFRERKNYIRVNEYEFNKVVGQLDHLKYMGHGRSENLVLKLSINPR